MGIWERERKKVEHLPSNCKALNSNSSTEKKRITEKVSLPTLQLGSLNEKVKSYNNTNYW
jgi:hypothetical protein